MKMTPQVLIDIIRDEQQKGNIVFFVSPDKLVTTHLDDFIQQPADGMLYDLNRDEVTALHFISNGDVKWVNNYAVALVIRKLKDIIEQQHAQSS